MNNNHKLWIKYKILLNERLRHDKTFLEGIKGEPAKLPSLFTSERLIKDYISKKIKNYKNLLTQTGGAISAEKVWIKYSTALIEKLRTDETYNGSKDSLPEAFIFPKNGKNKYTEWLTKSYVENGIEQYKNLESHAYEALMNYDILSAMKVLKSGKWNNEYDITSICGLKGCIKNGIHVKGLDELLSEHKDNLKQAAEKVPVVKSKPIYNGKNLRIYEIKSEEEACKYGKSTMWCTSSTAPGMNKFSEYAEKGKIYTIIPKKPKEENLNEKYQFHYEVFQFMNEKNEPVDIVELSALYPELIEFSYITGNILLLLKLNLKDQYLKLLELIYEDKYLTLYRLRSNESMQLLIPKDLDKDKEEEYYLISLNIFKYLNSKNENGSLLSLLNIYPTFMRLLLASELPKKPASFKREWEAQFIKSTKEDDLKIYEPRNWSNPSSAVCVISADKSYSKNFRSQDRNLLYLGILQNIYEEDAKSTCPKEIIFTGKGENFRPTNIPRGKVLPKACFNLIEKVHQQAYFIDMYNKEGVLWGEKVEKLLRGQGRQVSQGDDAVEILAKPWVASTRTPQE